MKLVLYVVMHFYLLKYIFFFRKHVTGMIQMMHQSRERFIGWQESDMGIGCARCESKGKRKNIYQKMYGKAGSNIGILLNIKRNVNKQLKIAV